MKNRTLFFTFVLPILFACCSLLSFKFPGDEYAMYAISSYVGSWIDHIVPFGDIHNPLIPISIALTGAVVMAGLGFLMDCLKASKRRWIILYIAGALGFFIYSVAGYPSIQEAIAKNGSLMAYALFSINLSLYLSTIISLVWKFTAVYLFKKESSKGQTNSPS